jgi:hypothetical protein
VHKDPEMDPKEEVSFQDNFTGVRVLIFGISVVFAGYYLHTRMQ